MIQNEILEIENSCQLTSTVYAWLRNDIPQETGYIYWRDIHGTLISRIPGKCIYRQLHMAPIINIFSGDFQKYINMVAIPEQVQGIAQSYYLNEIELDKFRQHHFTKIYMVEDEPNLVSMNASLWSTNGNAMTLKDNYGKIEPQGKPDNDEYVISFIFKNEIIPSALRMNILSVAKKLSDKNEIVRIRYHVLEDYDDENTPDTKVSHKRPVGVRYNAWIELGVQHTADLAEILEPILSEILDDITTIHVQPIFEKYTIVANSKPTVVGLKGYPAYKTILQAGADNQLNATLLDAIYG